MGDLGLGSGLMYGDDVITHRLKRRGKTTANEETDWKRKGRRRGLFERKWPIVTAIVYDVTGPSVAGEETANRNIRRW